MILCDAVSLASDTWSHNSVMILLESTAANTLPTVTLRLHLLQLHMLHDSSVIFTKCLAFLLESPQQPW